MIVQTSTPVFILSRETSHIKIEYPGQNETINQLHFIEDLNM